MLWLPNFKGHAFKLYFPAVHESNFIAYYIGCQILWPEKSIKSQKVDFKYRLFDLKILNSHLFDGFKCVEATQNKSRRIFSRSLRIFFILM